MKHISLLVVKYTGCFVGGLPNFKFGFNFGVIETVLEREPEDLRDQNFRTYFTAGGQVYRVFCRGPAKLLNLGVTLV